MKINVKGWTVGFLLSLSFCPSLMTIYAIDYKESQVQSWGGTSSDSFVSIAKTSDGGFVVVGDSNSTDAGFVNQGKDDAIIIKYDSEGNQEWIKSFGGSDDDNFRSVTETSDGGFVVVGYSKSKDAGIANTSQNYQAIIVKYDANGNQKWIQPFGGSVRDEFYSVISTSDGGVIVVGSSWSTDAGFVNQGSTDAIVVKYDQEGNQQWIQSWGGNYRESFDSVIETSDGGFVVVGSSASTNAEFPNQGETDAIIIKYDGNGNQQWIQSWGGNSYDSLYSVTETSDKGLVVVGSSFSINTELMNQGDSDILVIKYDKDGNREWIQSWGEGGDDYARSVIETLNHELVVVGYTTLINGDDWNEDGIVIKYDLDGNQQGVQYWRENDSDSFQSMIEMRNGELLIIGYSQSSNVGFVNQGGYDGILVKYSPKTDADIQINGNIQTMIADVTIPSVSPDLVIDPNSPDGAISPEFSIENQSTSPIKLDLRTFEQTTSSFNDVLPDKYDSWKGLNKTQSQDLALGLVAKEGEGWQRLITPTSYVANHTEHEIGVIKPTSQVNFEFEVHHGRAFSEAKTVQYRMVFVFDLLN